MSQDLDALIAQAAKTHKEVQDAETVRDAAERILKEATKRDKEADRALWGAIDNRVCGEQSKVN